MKIGILEQIEQGYSKVTILNEEEYGGYIGHVQADESSVEELLDLAKLGKRMQWVSVKTELPKVSGDYWGFDLYNNEQFKSSWNNNKQRWSISSSELGSALWRVTHYMPLPPNPEEAE